MDQPNALMARQIADAAMAFQQEQTGHAPQSVTVVMDKETLVITLHGALSPAEKVMAQTAAGAALVQEYHRRLFAGSSDALRRQITLITGIEVQEAAAEVEPVSGAVVHAFTSGTMVQVFRLARSLSTSASAAIPAPQFNHDPGNFAGSSPNPAKEFLCPPTMHP